MDNSFDRSALKPGVMLLYWSEDAIDRIIGVKTGYRIAHVEHYAGAGQSVASRNGIGVNIYPLRLEGLVMVREPVGAFDFAAALAYFQTVKGQPYDWEGLLTFTSLTTEGEEGKQFCSEFSINFLRGGGHVPCNPVV